MFQHTQEKMNDFLISGTAKTNPSIFPRHLLPLKISTSVFLKSVARFLFTFYHPGSADQLSWSGTDWQTPRLAQTAASNNGLIISSLYSKTNKYSFIRIHACPETDKHPRLLFPASTSSSSSSRYLAFDLFASLFVFVIWRDVNLATPRDCTLTGDTKKSRGGREKKKSE